MSDYIPQRGDNVRIGWEAEPGAGINAASCEGVWLGDEGHMWTPGHVWEHADMADHVEKLPEPWRWRLVDGVIFTRVDHVLGRVGWHVGDHIAVYAEHVQREWDEAVLEAKYVASQVVEP